MAWIGIWERDGREDDMWAPTKGKRVYLHVLSAKNN
jgi:hypothetical protein